MQYGNGIVVVGGKREFLDPNPETTARRVRLNFLQKKITINFIFEKNFMLTI